VEPFDAVLRLKTQDLWLVAHSRGERFDNANPLDAALLPEDATLGHRTGDVSDTHDVETSPGRAHADAPRTGLTSDLHESADHLAKALRIHARVSPRARHLDARDDLPSRPESVAIPLPPQLPDPSAKLSTTELAARRICLARSRSRASIAATTGLSSSSTRSATS
jgi:hypothetical protein